MLWEEVGSCITTFLDKKANKKGMNVGLTIFSSLKKFLFNDFELESIGFFKPIIDFGLKIWLFSDYESRNNIKNKPIDKSMAQRHGQRRILPQ